MKYRKVDNGRPGQIREMLGESLISYARVSALEWHAEHNGLGLDGLQAEGLCCHRVRPSRAH